MSRPSYSHSTLPTSNKFSTTFLSLHHTDNISLFGSFFFCAFTKGKTHCEEFFLIKRTHFFFGPAEILALSKKICHKISREQRQMSYPSFGPSRQITANRHLQISIPIWTFRFYNSFFLFFSFFCLLSFLYFFTHTYPPLFLSGDEFI